MLGDGPLRQRMLKRSSENSFTLLPGAVSNEQVALYMRAADLMVLPSLTEGRPVSVLEAMQIGLPVLASRVGDIPELIKDGVNGILIEPGSERQLTEELRRLISNPGLLNHLRDEAMQRVKNDQFLLPSLLEEVLKNPDYDQYWRNAQHRHFKRRARERARTTLSLLPGGVRSVLDAGCGRGETLQMLTSCGYNANGVDISSVAVSKVKEHGLKAGILDLEKDTIDQDFDAVVCMEVLEHLSEPEAALRKLSNALREGGCLIVSLPNEKNIYHLFKNIFAPNPAHLHCFTHGRAVSLFARAGLTVARRVPLALLPNLPGFGLLRRALCRLWPAAFAISNVYLLKPESSVLDPDENWK
jgi:2-polyprenyl-3-methyl-5-hydroxy-6-metoxy-1,4-benzoquinol methylase